MSYVRFLLFATLGLTVLAVSGASTSANGPASTERVSVDSAGTQADGSSGDPSVSADGRFVAFVSGASNLVPGDTNGVADVFVHDRQTADTTRVSVSSSGAQGNGMSGAPAVSGDGRYVAFQSAASNLVPGDTNARMDVFVADVQMASVERVSVDSSGNQANDRSYGAAISADGCYVAFYSYASNLVSGDTNTSCLDQYYHIINCPDVFVYDCQTGATTRVSVGSSANQGNGWSQLPAISADGRYVAFESDATNLVSGDGNGSRDVFVHDRPAGTTTRVSVDSGGNEVNWGGDYPAITADGRYVAFQSVAENLVPGDTNAAADVFVHDRQTGVTQRVSVDSAGNQGNYGSEFPAVSSDGRYVAFQSVANNLVPDDTNEWGDFFVHDRQTGSTARVSVDSSGNQGIGGGSIFFSSISADGHYVAFESDAVNLVPGDSNGWPDIFVRHVGDTDGDGEWDPFDPCPANPDCDGDAFHDGLERYVATDPLDACPDVLATPGLCPGPSCDGDDAWPPDINVDTWADVGDILEYKPVILTTVPPSPPRYDLDMDQYIDVGDILMFKPVIITQCTNP